MNDTTAVVMGTSSGIDVVVVRVLGRTGAAVVACARDGDALQSVANDIERDDGSASAVRADVRNELDMERLIETAARVGGHIDVLIANAAVAYGTSGEMPVLEDSYAALDDILRINVHGVFTAVKEALPHMADDGRILVPSGSIAREAKPGMGVYVASKAAAETLVRQFTADRDRTVTVVDPGLVATDLTGGQGRGPDDAADLLVWAAADADLAEFDGGVVDLKAWKRATR